MTLEVGNRVRIEGAKGDRKRFNGKTGELKKIDGQMLWVVLDGSGNTALGHRVFFWTEVHPEMRAGAREAKIIDELLVLFDLYDEDYKVVDDALEVVAEHYKAGTNFPLTKSLATYMREEGYIE